jgi:hypothetical protein
MRCQKLYKSHTNKLQLNNKSSKHFYYHFVVFYVIFFLVLKFVFLIKWGQTFEVHCSSIELFQYAYFIENVYNYWVSEWGINLIILKISLCTKYYIDLKKLSSTIKDMLFEYTRLFQIIKGGKNYRWTTIEFQINSFG